MFRLLVDRLSGWGLFGALVPLAVLAAPAPAVALDISDIFGPGHGPPAEFSIRASNGFSISVTGSKSHVTLSASGPTGAASYRVPGRVSTRGITANFGKRGMVDVAFRPSQRMALETPPNRCQGRPRATRWGVFVGTIRFDGERGFTKLDAGRAGGRTHTLPDWKCGRRRHAATGGSARSSAEAPPVVLSASDPRTGLRVGALYSDFFDEAIFFASLDERRKRMRISRSVTAFAKARAFIYEDGLTAATVSPPKPFAGKGEFERRPGGPDSWTGSLSVLLPGTKRISLVGRRYHPRLYRLTKDGIAKPGT